MDRAKTWLASHLENGSSTNRILSMEGQRGVAVALVFLVHYVALFSRWLTPGSAGLGLAQALQSIGFIGVDLFFVISGYLIYGIVVRKAIDHRAFAMRRVERIYPAFLVMLALYCALALAGGGEGKLPTSRAGTALYFAENLLLLPGVFPIKPLITVAWSLSFEIFYYLSIPILVSVLRLRGWRPGARIALIALSAAVWLPLCHVLGLWLHAKTVMFAGGMIVWELRAQKREARTHGLALAAALLALPVAFAFSDWAALSDALHLGDWGVFVRQGWLALALPLVVYDSYSGRGPLARFFSWLPMRWLGNMSYSYYLMHGLALKFMAAIAVRLVPHAAPAWFWLAMPAIFLATIVPSFALYTLVERRFSLSAPSSPRAAAPATAAAGLAAVAPAMSDVVRS
jgi:exopolysaccharide production protein ExoZ